MSDPRDRPVFGGASVRGPLHGPLNDDSVRQSRSHGIMGPPRGSIVVAEAPKSKKSSKPQAKVDAREISVVGSFDNPWKNEADEVDAMYHDRWEPTTDDFKAVAGKSAVPVDSWKSLLRIILTTGDAESAAGSISRINIFTHANSNLIALAGHVRPRSDAQPDVTLTVSSAISEETLDQLDSGITIKVVSNDKKLASKEFVMDDVRKRFTKDAVIVIYACHGAVETAFVQRIANTFQVKVRAFHDVIGYYPSFDDADTATNHPAKVTNRRKVGVGHNSKVKVDDFHKLDSNAVDRAPKIPPKPVSASDDDD